MDSLSSNFAIGLQVWRTTNYRRMRVVAKPGTAIRSEH
jgi:hypothetical protein